MVSRLEYWGCICYIIKVILAGLQYRVLFCFMWSGQHGDVRLLYFGTTAFSTTRNCLVSRLECWGCICYIIKVILAGLQYRVLFCFMWYGQHWDVRHLYF